MSLDVVVSTPRDLALKRRDQKRIDPHRKYPTPSAKRGKLAREEKPYGISYEWRIGYFAKKSRQRTFQWYTTEVSRDQAYRAFEKKFAGGCGHWYRNLRNEFRGGEKKSPDCAQ